MHTSRPANDLQLQLGQDPLLPATAQALRCRVFQEEPGAVADHLVVIDRRRVAPGAVGCNRLQDRYRRRLAARAPDDAVAA